ISSSCTSITILARRRPARANRSAGGVAVADRADVADRRAVQHARRARNLLAVAHQGIRRSQFAGLAPPLLPLRPEAGEIRPAPGMVPVGEIAAQHRRAKARADREEPAVPGAARGAEV